MQLASCETAAVRGRGRSTWSCHRPSLTRTSAWTKKKPGAAAVGCAASSRRDDADSSFSNGGSWRLVDESMAVLRRRIDEMRAAERGSWEPPPVECAACEESEWHATCDDADVCEQLVYALRALLLSARPGVGVGLLAALLALAVPASAFVLLAHLLPSVLSNLPH
ncbi:hypothetical protein PR202_gb26613 [Eleusine coracana subsp. coracana]|uniref:Uncharacterized protein n=1 Tax=Eleusine coracana subsp. coracana TaxID=191504 RepID=A0AAV5FRZ0_ELECO|nr:hypothetical protein QOZ80_1BG0056460 [Eleusine coracana subsp. coracana]GJN37638.1 hypothetical protein PR202_gb26613 [Eleusine coracana subsp. coracana]